MAKRRKMTAEERKRFEAIKARIAAKKAAEDIEDEEILDEDTDSTTEDIEKEKEAAFAAYIARKYAQEVKKDEDPEDIALEQPEMTGDPEGDEPEPREKEEALRAKTIARAKAIARAKKARKAKKAQEISDDLTGPDGDSSNIGDISNNGEHVSDDLTDPDEGDGGIAQTPPDSADEAESKVLAAYNLIEKQIAHKVIASNIHRASVAHEYCKNHTLGEMKFAAEQLEKVGSVKKTAGNVRVTRRGSGLQNKKTASHVAEDPSILFA